MKSIGFIGGGNMASSLIAGLLNSAKLKSGKQGADKLAKKIIVAEPSATQRKTLTIQFGINTCASNLDLLDADVIIFAVKPQQLNKVCLQIAPKIKRQCLFISIAAGVTTKLIDTWLGGDCAIVRTMPNTPAMLQCGATGMLANTKVSLAQKKVAEDIMQAVGLALWVESEDQINAVTALSGSGPAYFFLLMEQMQNAGENLGLPQALTQKLVTQTALGAAKMVMQGGDSPATLRAQVTSKGGTTEQAILSFQRAGFKKMVSDALGAAYLRAAILAQQLANK